MPQPTGKALWAAHISSPRRIVQFSNEQSELKFWRVLCNLFNIRTHLWPPGTCGTRESSGFSSSVQTAQIYSFWWWGHYRPGSLEVSLCTFAYVILAVSHARTRGGGALRSWVANSVAVSDRREYFSALTNLLLRVILVKCCVRTCGRTDFENLWQGDFGAKWAFLSSMNDTLEMAFGHYVWQLRIGPGSGRSLRIRIITLSHVLSPWPRDCRRPKRHVC